MNSKNYSRMVLATFMFLFLFISATYASGIQGDLIFTAETVYYGGDTVVIYGYWFNDTNKYIPYTNWVNMNVYALHRNFQELVASGQFNQRSYIYLEPGEAQYWTYRIHNCPIIPLYRWQVDTEVNYNWRNSAADI